MSDEENREAGGHSRRKVKPDASLAQIRARGWRWWCRAAGAVVDMKRARDGNGHPQSRPRVEESQPHLGRHVHNA